MVIPIMPKATVGERGPRRRPFRGRLLASRQLRGVAIIGALVLALGVVATLATIQLRPGSPAVSVPAPIAVTAPWTGTCRSDVAGCVPEEVLVPGVPTSPSYTYPAVYGDDEGVTPGDAVSPPLTGARVQQELYATEVRDNGPGTPGGTSGPCPPLQLCDR